MKIVICLNTAWNLLNFRAGLIRALVAAGHEVVAVAPEDKYAASLNALGCRFVPLHMENGGTNPLKDALLTWRFLRLFIDERPDIYLGYTIKPNVYGSIAAHLLRISVINNIAGLGIVFGRIGFLQKVVRILYRLALNRSAKVFFQNNDDRNLFITDALVKAELTDLLPGSGVDLSRFVPMSIPSANSETRKFRFLLISRMLWEKGIGEFADAAKLIRYNWPQTEFCLLGFLDVQNPDAVSRTEMDSLVASGINYLGASDDVRVEIANADCIVLPSYYREGTPRTLLEAAAMARPIITTDAVGCREVVIDGVNGYLCKVRDAEDLAAKMNQMLCLSVEQRKEMGLRGRAKMQSDFDETIVIKKYLTVIDKIQDKKALNICV
jgi:glycosyltransferase involved in cell wall biosynthesis